MLFFDNVTFSPRYYSSTLFFAHVIFWQCDIEFTLFSYAILSLDFFYPLHYRTSLFRRQLFLRSASTRDGGENKEKKKAREIIITVEQSARAVFRQIRHERSCTLLTYIVTVTYDACDDKYRLVKGGWLVTEAAKLNATFTFNTGEL